MRSTDKGKSGFTRTFLYKVYTAMHMEDCGNQLVYAFSEDRLLQKQILQDKSIDEYEKHRTEMTLISGIQGNFPNTVRNYLQG